jgi:hypothetical protein
MMSERRFRRKTREAAQLEGGVISIRRGSKTTSEYRVESVRRENKKEKKRRKGLGRSEMRLKRSREEKEGKLFC